MSDQERIDRYAEAITSRPMCEHEKRWEEEHGLNSNCDVCDARAAVAVADAELDALKAENAMLRACRDSEQRAAVANLPIVAAATEGPRMWAEPDGFGEPTIWHEIAGAPQPVLAKSDLCVGARHLWPVVVARLTAGSAT